MTLDYKSDWKIWYVCDIFDSELELEKHSWISIIIIYVFTIKNAKIVVQILFAKLSFILIFEFTQVLQLFVALSIFIF